MIPPTTSFALKWIEKHAQELEDYGYDFSWIPAAANDAVELDDIVVALANADIPPFNTYDSRMYLCIDQIFKCWKGYKTAITFMDNYISNPDIWENVAKIAQALGLFVYKLKNVPTDIVSNRACPYIAVAKIEDLTGVNLRKLKSYLFSTSQKDYQREIFTFNS